MADWLLTIADREEAARRYLFYLKLLDETFHTIEELYPRSSDPARGIGSSPEELLHLANHLYLLTAAGVPGAVLECGSYKGFSASCLSHAAEMLGRKLIVADSFAGLPVGGVGEEGYRPGDFRGLREEVEANVRLFGRIGSVRFLAGWFAQSLRGFDEPLSLLFLDVDLYDSARDALDGALAALDPRGALFSHEFLPGQIDGAGRIVHPIEPPGAIHDGLERRGVAYQAVHCAGWLARIDRAQALGIGAERLVAALRPRLQDLDHRARAARSAIGWRPALRDLAARRLGWRRRPG